jgi:hypothetical protein
MVGLFGLRHALEQQYHGASHGCNIDGFKSGIQDQYWLLHNGRAAMSGWGSRPRLAGRASGQ